MGKRCRAASVLAGVFLLIVVSGAAVPATLDAGGQLPARGAGPAPAPRPTPQGAPARDAVSTAAPADTAVIRGRVLAADTGRPLRRARVTAFAATLGQDSRRTTSTDADGRFEFTELRPARYRVSVTRGGYLPLEYGQRRPGEQGRPVQVGEQERFDNIDFVLPRMSVITGRVTDETGDPIEGVNVYAMRSMFFEGERKLVPVNSGMTRTDDTGAYRILRLEPGSYAVMASTRETWVVNNGTTVTTLGYLPTFFPGVPAPASARRVTVGVGQEVVGTDFSLVPGRAPRVSGIALDSKGRPFTNVTLQDEVRGVNFGSFGSGPRAVVAADGSFTIPNVPPAEYTLAASRTPDQVAIGPPEAALLPLVVVGDDIENVILTGSAGGMVEGTVVANGTAPLKMSSVRLTVTAPFRTQPPPILLGVFRSSSGFGTSAAADDGSFTIPHVFGRSRFQVTVPDGWMLDKVEFGGRDITDQPIELRSGEEWRGVQVTITDRVTTVSGQLLDGRQQPLRDATVLLFPDEPDKWFESSRSIKATRPDQQGQWQITGLPPGDYLAVARDYIEDLAWNDPEYLESLRDDGRKVRIAAGSTQSLAVTVSQPRAN